MALSSLLLLLAVPALQATFMVCNYGMINYEGYCYGLVSSRYTHDEAESYCNQRYGTKLATIVEPDLNVVIATNAKSYETVWLGYQCNSTTQCVGDDGSVINTSQYFYGGMANPTIGQCVVMDTSGPMAGKWVSLDCNQRSSSVCGLDHAPNVISSMRASKCGVPYQLNVNEVSGVNITSMNYPSNYDNSENCAYFIYSNGPFTIYFDDFYTENGIDYVSIYSSAFNSGKLTFVGEYSGNLSPFNVSIPNTAALITFVTDASTNHKGFSARIK